MSSFLQDLRYATRMLAKTPGFTAVAILTLALGIGANVAAFSVVRAVLLRPLPYPQPGQLVRVFDDLRASNVRDVGMSQPELEDLQNRSDVFADISAVWPISANLTGGDRPERVEVVATNTNYFTLLGANAQLGRIYTKQETVPGFIEAAVISDGFWRREFGADPHAIGRKIRLDGDLYTIVGVMPPDFRHPGRTLQTDVDLWIAAGYAANPFPTPPQRAIRMFPGAIGRLKPGLSAQAAQAKLDTFAANLSREYPGDYPAAASWAPRVLSIQDDLVGGVRAELFVLFGAVGCVLLIACVNIANLLLARGAGRQREIAIRLALGASRGRLIGQLLTESVLLAAVSGVIALVTVVALKNSLLALAPADLPRLNEVSIGGGVLLFAFFVSMLTGVVFGLVPALQAASPNQIVSLREGSRGSGSSKKHTRVSRFLVASEIALSLILLIGAGLLLRSFWQLLQVKPGFNPSSVVTAQIWMPVPNDPSADPYRPPEKRSAFYRELLRRVEAIPGVQQAAIGSGGSLPMTRGRNSRPFVIEGRPADAERIPLAEFAAVTPEYFRTLEIPLISGRNFTDSDGVGSQRVVLVDATLAQRYWPNEDPIGKQIKFGQGNPQQAPWNTIVGVVAPIKSDGFDAPVMPHVYLSLLQNPGVTAAIYLRTGADPGTLGDLIRHEVQSVDPGIPVFAVRTMNEVVARSLADRRFALVVLGVFAGVALLLASIGIYGVMAYTFSQRTHEIGVRVALGAQRGDILRMALGEGMILVAIGLGAGLIGAAIVTRFLRSMLFSITPTDPITFGSIAALLAAVALLACFIPARRATEVDPLVALRED
ncbi:MAG: ABC transporter permease [Candidatus Acidiferrales bacterium]